MAGRRFIDLTGQRFGRLIVSHEDGMTTKSEVRWACLCDCGKTKTVRAGHLKRGIVSSCGCLRRESVAARMTTHGQSKGRAHRTWRNMRDRCGNPNSNQWPEYGGRGIAVCDRWQSFENFYADMGDPPPGTSIDRIDNERGYETGNCRWATDQIQGRNRRCVIEITFNGKTQSLKEWAKEIGISWTALRDRHKKGEQPPMIFRPVDQARVHR